MEMSRGGPLRCATFRGRWKGVDQADRELTHQFLDDPTVTDVHRAPITGDVLDIQGNSQFCVNRGSDIVGVILFADGTSTSRVGLSDNCSLRCACSGKTDRPR